MLYLNKVRVWQWSLLFILGFGLSIFMALFVIGNTKKDTLSDNAPEELRCSKKEGKYFDPIQKRCISPTTREQAYILSSYRYVNEIAFKDDSSHEYSLTFNRWLTFDELKELMSSFGDFKVTTFSLCIPNEECIGERFYYAHIASINESNSTSLEEAPNAVIEAWKNRGSEHISKPEAAVAQEKFYVISMNIWAPSKRTLEFWKQHMDDIAVIEPIITDLDRAIYGLVNSLPVPLAESAQQATTTK